MSPRGLGKRLSINRNRRSDYSPSASKSNPSKSNILRVEGRSKELECALQVFLRRDHLHGGEKVFGGRGRATASKTKNIKDFDPRLAMVRDE